MQTGPTDTDLIKRVLGGEPNAYATIVDRYKNLVFSIVIRYIKSREDAEEVSQDIFVKAYRSLSDFRGASKFSTWLFTIATTTCLTFLRKKKNDIASLDDERVFAMADNIDGGMRSDAIEQKNRVQTVNEAIKMLSADDAQIITLFYKSEQTLEEIAKILGKEPNTVKVQLHRARAKMKEKMERYFSAEVKELNS